MDGLIILFAIVALFGALAAAAQRWGVDSRDGSVDPRTHAGRTFNAL
ncbi:MAG: hypothetical protein H0V74_09175 [Chloroflexi bacterium]|nr:hypothetical protein [Chloroflexota bacterium]